MIPTEEELNSLISVTDNKCVFCGKNIPQDKKACRECLIKHYKNKKRKNASKGYAIIFLLALLLLALVNPLDLFTGSGESTTSENKDVELKYVLRGDEGSVRLMVSGKIKAELSKLPRKIFGSPSDEQIEKKYLDNEVQKLYLNNLIQEIRHKTDDSEDQARIAISLVQHIPYDMEKYENIENALERYPYEVLYDEKGLCGEKSKLLAYILRELGYGTALIKFEEKHMAAGVKCPIQYSYQNTGYCFIETVKPIIPTQKPLTYWMFPDGLPDKFKVIPINDGESLDLEEEYYDAQTSREIQKKGRVLSEKDYYTYLGLADKYGIQFDED